MRKKKDGKDIYQKQTVQITVDFEYAQKDRIVNCKDLSLPKNIIIEIFKYVKPTKLLALYTTNNIKIGVLIDYDPFAQKHFNVSNLGWICNYFGLETFFIMKLFKILMSFLYTEKVETYIEKTKIYQQNWKEWMQAQSDLNINR